MRATAVLNLRSVIEVEQKFCCGPKSREIFRSNKGSPSFHRVENVGQSTFEDLYFDYRRQLSTNGVWVRRRNGIWQAKVRADHSNSTYINSRFEELSEPSEILRLVRRFVHGVKYLPTEKNGSDVREAGLEVMARYTTYRDTWKFDEGFEVVLDRTDFGHWVGEVELQREIEVAEEEMEALTQRQAISAEMDRDIQSFMERYRWAFPVGSPVGKLTAYFAKGRSHW
ncbi:putative thiamine-triphosphatase [Microsporum ferrugineum]